jgi:hypothetical protein
MYYYNKMYFHQLVHKIKIKCIENFTGVQTCFGLLITPSSGEQTETCRDPCEIFYKFYFNCVYELVKIYVVLCNRI